MATQKLTDDVKEKLKSNSRARYKLCYEFNVHNNTIIRWLDGDKPDLVTPAGLRAISELLEIPIKNLTAVVDKKIIPQASLNPIAGSGYIKTT